jgi:uncharacterized protein
MIDLSRAVALLGIAVINVGLMAYPGEVGYHLGGLTTALDHVALWVVTALFAFKAYTLFALGFGAGLGVQQAAAAAQGRPFAPRYTRRLLGLALLGLVNVLAFFYGDILFVYAVLGALLVLFRASEAGRLIRWAWVLYGLQIALFVLLAAAVGLWAWAAPEDMARELAQLPASVARDLAGFGSPHFAEVAMHRLHTWSQDIGLLMLMQGLGVFAFMLAGLALWRRGLLERPADPFWRRCRRLYLPLGLVVSAVGAALLVAAERLISPQALLGLCLVALGSPWSAAGYLGLIAAWAQRPASPLRRFMALAGSASLSAYLLQGLLLSLVFSGYGLGLYAQVGAATCIAIAAAAGGVSLAAAGLWRQRFSLGPAEWLLRRWTYLGPR